MQGRQPIILQQAGLSFWHMIYIQYGSLYLWVLEWLWQMGPAWFQTVLGNEPYEPGEYLGFDQEWTDSECSEKLGGITVL